MSVQRILMGEEQVPVVVIDNFFEDPEHIIDLAVDVAPFPRQEGHYYPGVRHRILPNDTARFGYIEAVCQALGPLMHEVYGLSRYEITDAGFSLVTMQPDALGPLQRVPHFDHADGEGFAIIHYLSRHPGGGTAFYRHDRTGFETLSMERLDVYGPARAQDLEAFGQAQGYHSGDANGFTELGMVEARFNRAAIYPGNVLHSGVIPPDFAFSPDPRRGRLTANVFVRARG